MTVKEDKEVYMGVFKGRKGGGEIMYSISSGFVGA